MIKNSLIKFRYINSISTTTSSSSKSLFGNSIKSYTTTTSNTGNNGNREQYDVVIVGGGLVGSAMACSLGSNPNTSHLKVALIESAPIQSVQDTLVSPVPDIRTISFNHQTIQLFKDIGAWDIINATKRVNPFTQVRVWDTSGFGGVHFGEHSNFMSNPDQEYMGYIIENKVVTASLLERAKSFSNITIKSPSSVLSLENYNINSNQQQTDSTTTETSPNDLLPIVKLKDNTEISAKLIIGADGGNSVLKKQLQVPSMGRNYNQRAVVCTLKLGVDKCDSLYQRFLTTGPIALLPLSGGYANIIWSTNNLHANYLLELDDESFLDQVKHSFLSNDKPASTDFLGQLYNNYINLNPTNYSGNELYLPPIESLVSKRASFPLRIDHTFEYTHSRLCFIGDASHLVHPMAGQGVNLGMADVKSLSNKIGESVRSGYDIGDSMMLKTFEEERKGANMKMMLSIDTLFNIFNNNTLPMIALRNFGMSFLNHITPLKNIIVDISKGKK